MIPKLAETKPPSVTAQPQDRMDDCARLGLD
jgi:hypothetical protein